MTSNTVERQPLQPSVPFTAVAVAAAPASPNASKQPTPTATTGLNDQNDAAASATLGTFYRKFSLHRTLSRYSRRSYISNLSSLNRANLARFGRSKIAFLIVNTIFTFAAIALLVFTIFTIAGQYSLAPLIKLWHLDVLYVLTATAAFQLVIGIIGFIGAFAHKKSLLTFVMLLIWPLMAGYLYAGYVTYRESHSTQWENNLGNYWSNYGTTRHNIQVQFQCCGYASNFDRPYPDAICAGFFNSTPTNMVAVAENAQNMVHLVSRQAADANLAGCREAWSNFSHSYLFYIYTGSFTLLPYVILVFIVLILGANHIYMD